MSRRPNRPRTSGNAAPESQHDLGLERLIFFSDAVFAIAITLLALEIRLPAGAEIASDADLLAALIGLWPRYLSYAVSFLVIGSYWLVHHRMFRSIVRYDRRMLGLNLLLLLGIAFIPFPTTVLGEYTGAVATQFYGLTILVVGLVSASLWWYASGGKGRLLAAPLPARQLWLTRLRMLIPPLIFALSIAVAGWNADAARYSWIAIAPAMLLARAADTDETPRP